MLQAIEQQINNIVAQSKKQLERGADLNEEEISDQVCASCKYMCTHKQTHTHSV
jgi:hypothetical protein